MLCGSDFPSLAIGFSNWNRRKCTYGEELYAKWLLHKHNLWSSFESVVLKRSNSMDPNFWDPAQVYSEKAPSQGWVLHHHPVSPLRAIRIACHPVDFQASPHSLTHFVCGGQSNQMIFLPFIPRGIPCLVMVPITILGSFQIWCLHKRGVMEKQM